jgi:alpha-beta hydrolase superfamily lysophospholipase
MEFKTGEYQLNKEPNFNFQLNRTIMWDGGNIKDIEPISQKITNSETWKKELILLGDIAIKDNRIKEAIAYYRMSEFFMYDGDSDKLLYYQKATNMFYDYYSDFFSSGRVKKFEVPYEDIVLPVLFSKANGTFKGCIIFHGGNDSYMEELFFGMLYLSEHGFDVYLFEGPGQGGVLRTQGKPFIHEWEKPVSKICDYFNLDDVTIIGASLGGMLAPRAAAFEKRIKYVVCWSIFPNFLYVTYGLLSKKLKKIFAFLIKIKARFLINIIANLKMKRNQLIHWGLKHGMYAYKAKTPYDYFKKINRFQILDIGNKIDQDILIIGATQDHFIDYHLYKEEIDVLKNVHSLTFKLFTEKQNASAHCNVGNTKLILDTIVNWILTIK